MHDRPLRERFMTEAVTFVRAARALAGVRRMALIGSIVTDKPDPKDIGPGTTTSTRSRWRHR